MNIKGFDQNLCCRGMQFEVGKEYKTGFNDDELTLCSETVFHYCKSLIDVNSFYSVKNSNNRFCEIEVLGKEITDGKKYGSNHIKILREISEDELLALKGIKRFNTGFYNI